MPDNTLPTAQNLGNLTSTLTVADTVNSTDTIDFYRFTLTGTSDVNIALMGLSADANIRLIRDTNNNGIVDAGEIIASSAFTGTNPDSINVSALVAGNYFVAVDRVGSNNTNYTLKLSPDDINNLLAQEANFGNLSATPITRSGFVGNLDNSDIYRFSLASASDINITMTGLTADADLRVIRDVNNNGIADAGEVINSSTASGTANDVINVNNQAAGNYFVQVYQFSDNQTNYTLRLTNTNPSNLIAEEGNLGTIGSTPASAFDSVSGINASDIYRFNLATQSDINISLSGLSANASVRLIRDANNNSVIDAGEVILAATASSTIPGSINLNDRAAGDYFVQVNTVNSNSTNYTLRVSNSDPSNLLAQEVDIGNLSATGTTRSGSVGNLDTSDIYRFTLASTNDINIALTGMTADADLYLIRDANNNGVADAGEIVASSRAGGIGNDTINLNNQAAGTYFVQVSQYFNNETNYTLLLSNNSISNFLAEEEILGILGETPISRTQSAPSGGINDLDTSDVYRFNLTNPGNINVSLTGLSADADLRVIRDANNNGIVDSGEVLASSTFSSNTPDSINLNNQAAGNYFVQVYQIGNNSTSYTLRLSNSEPNNLLAEESNLGTLSLNAVRRFGFVGNIDTSDVYRFNLAAVSDINIALTGMTADADLLLIRDINNNGILDANEIVNSSTRFEASDEAIDLNNQAAGNYFVQVYQVGSNETSYTLQLSTDQPSNVIAVQENFGVLAAGGSGISYFDSVGNLDTSDFFRFSLDSTRNVTASINGLTADADFRLIRDINNNGTVDSGEQIAVSNGTLSLETINQVLNAGDYFLQAYQFSGDTNYTLAVNAL